MQRTANTRAGPKVSPSALVTAAKATFGSGNALQLVSNQPGAILGEPKPGQGGGEAIVDPYYNERGIVDPYYNERGIVDPYYVPRKGIIDPAFATSLQAIIDPAFHGGGESIIAPSFAPQAIIDPAFDRGGVAGKGIIAPSFIIDPAWTQGIIDPAFSPTALMGGGNGAIAGEAIVAPSFGGGPVL